MTIYLLNIILIVVWGLVLSFSRDKRLKIALLVITAIQFIAVFSLRSTQVGTDTPGYIEGWRLSFNNTFLGFFTGSYTRVFAYEWGFTLLNYMISMFTRDPQIYLLVMSILIFIPLFFILYKYSSSLFLSVLLYVHLGLFNLSLTMLRQSLAMSITLIAFHYLTQNKRIRFVVVVLFAALFHKSALIFLPALLMKQVKLKWNVALLSVYLLALGLVFLYREALLTLFTSLVDNYSNTLGDTGSYTLFAVFLLIFSMSVLRYREAIQKDSRNNIYFTFMAVSGLMLTFTSMSYLALRLTYYYYIYFILFIPEIIQSFTERDRMLLPSFYLITLALTFGFYMNSGIQSFNTPYKFFWE